MATRIQLRRDTAANWTLNNPTLAEGELGLETDTLLIKCGDGTTDWATLAYVNQIAPGTISLLDNEKFISGTSDDLQMYHDGTDSFIVSINSAPLLVRGDSVTVGEPGGQKGLLYTSGGAVTLYHNNAAKVATSATGASVTGNLIASGNVTGQVITGTNVSLGSWDIELDGSNNLVFKYGGDTKMKLTTAGGLQVEDDITAYSGI
jgi:hypothetical protein